MTQSIIDLDDYVAAIEALQHEIGEYQRASDTLQSLSAITLKSHQTNEETASQLVDFVGSVKSDLVALSESLSETLIRIQQLDLEVLQGQVAERYDSHQRTLEGLATSVGDAVREQQRLGLQLLQQTNLFQTELTPHAAQLQTSIMNGREEREQMAGNWRAISTEFTTAAELTKSRLSEVQAAINEQSQAIGWHMKLGTAGIVLVLVLLAILIIE